MPISVSVFLGRCNFIPTKQQYHNSTHLTLINPMFEKGNFNLGMMLTFTASIIISAIVLAKINEKFGVKSSTTAE